MSWSVPLLLGVALLSAEVPAGKDAARLTTLVEEIQSADFRGERCALRRLARDLDAVEAPELAAHREYWRGFALWRSAINAGNETPPPPDMRADLEGAIQAFHAALEHSPGWIEPKIGLLFSWVGLAYAPGADASKPAVSREEFVALAGELKQQGQRNPRALWFLGGSLLFAPPPVGGDPAGAAATYRRALAAARDEALRGPETPWVPAWGAPENLMSLAYLYSHSALENRELARAYADGALALAPHWHYVRDLLVPQIEALPAKAP